MSDSMDFCKFFTDIEKDPMAPVQLTVRQYLQASDHVLDCKTCYARAERVASRYPEKNAGIDIGLN